MAEYTVTGLRAVREVAREGSLSAAADRLGYTQSAVSRQIALMEQAAGRTLFDRHARGVRPTDAGHVLVRHAATVLSALASARHDLDDLGPHPSARLRVGGFATALAALVPRAIARYRERDPHTRLPIREGLSSGLLSLLARGRLDLAVVTAYGEVPADVTLTALVDDPLLIAMHPRHRLAGRPAVPPDELRGERWIAGSRRPGSTLLGVWAEPDPEPEIAFVARDWTAKLGLVAAGLGVTVVPGLALPALPASVVVSRIDHPAAVRTTALATRTTATDEPRLAGVTEAIRDTAADLAAEVRRTLHPRG